jgi:hypothetical protein
MAARTINDSLNREKHQNFCDRSQRSANVLAGLEASSGEDGAELLPGLSDDDAQLIAAAFAN